MKLLVIRSSLWTCQLVVAIQYISATLRDDPEGSAVFNVKLMIKCTISNRPFVELDVLVAFVFELHTFQIVAKLKVFTTSTQLGHHMFA
jgi:hypothetical protein